MTLSINTNTAAMAALETLNNTTTQLNQTQNQVSTGYAVSTASDNPAVYSISQTMNSQISALSGVSTGLQYTSQVLNTANNGATSISGILKQMASAVATNPTSTVTTADINTQLSSYLTEINNAANTSTFQGVNLLAGATGGNVQYNSVSTAQDINGDLYSQSGFNATAAGLGLSGLNLNQSGAQVSLGNSTFNDVDTTGTGAKTASSLTIKNNQVGGTPTAQAPAVTYNFVMDSNSAGMQATTSLANAINAGLGGTTGITVASNGALNFTGAQTPGGTALTVNSTTSQNGTTTYALSNGESIAASKDANGNTTFTASSAFDANGNPTTQSVIVDVNTSAADKLSSTGSSGSLSAQTVGQRNALMQAMSTAGFGVSADANNNLTIAGNNIGSSAADTTVNNLATGTASTSVVSGSQVASMTVQAAITRMNSISSSLGAATNQVSQFESSTSSLSDALTTGVGALTDADLAAESAKLTSLQTKQQLAIQSLSIANSQPQTLMSLFRG